MPARFYAIFLIAFALTGCEEVVDLGVNFDKQVVVIAEIAPDRPFITTISYAQPVLSREPINYIETAEVSLKNTGSGIEIPLILENPNKDTLNPDLPHHPYFVADDAALQQVSDIYELSVNVPEQELITAITNIPEKVKLNEVMLDRFARNDDPREEDIYNAEVSFKFNHDDLIGQDYHLVFYFRYIFFEAQDRDTVYFVRTQVPDLQELNTAVPYITHFENGALLNGSDVRSGTHRLQAVLSMNFAADLSPYPPQLVVELRNTNIHYHQYHLGLSRQFAQQDSILSQAIVIPSNIEGGLGVFGGYNYDNQLISLTN